MSNKEFSDVSLGHQVGDNSSSFDGGLAGDDLDLSDAEHEASPAMGPSAPPPDLLTPSTLQFQDIAHGQKTAAVSMSNASTNSRSLAQQQDEDGGHSSSLNAAVTGLGLALAMGSVADGSSSSSSAGPSLGSGGGGAKRGPGGGNKQQQQQQHLGQQGGSASSGSGLLGSGVGLVMSAANPQAPFYSLAYYRSYFDVDTVQIAQRLRRALVPLPLNAFFYTDEDPKADLYGPFWVTTTLIFLMAATGNFAEYLAYLNNESGHTEGPSKVWQYDFEKVTLAASLLYSTITLLPLFVWIAMTYIFPPEQMNRRSLVYVVSIYGYSLFVYLPTALICMAPLEWLRWLAVTVSCAISARFVVHNLCSLPAELLPGAGAPNALSPTAKRHAAVLTIVILVLQAALAISTKLYFFHYD